MFKPVMTCQNLQFLLHQHIDVKHVHHHDHHVQGHLHEDSKNTSREDRTDVAMNIFCCYAIVIFISDCHPKMDTL